MGTSHYTMDCLSSATWASTIDSENKARKAWKAKYGSQFELPDSADPSRANSRMSQRDQPTTSRPATQCSRPATGMSQNSTKSVNAEKRKQLQDLKKKLMSALEEVDSELAETGR